MIGKNDEEFKQDGIPGLLTSEAYNIAWTDYQGHMVERLNALLANDNRKDWDPKTLLLNTARDPQSAAMFNYASMAHNNHFYFSSLAKQQTHMPEDLQRHLTTSFSSLDTLRSTFLSTAAATFGPSFTWLVQTHNPSPNHPSVTSSPSYSSTFGRSSSAPQQLHFRILTTYLAGSPYPGAHYRAQSRDMNTQNLRSAEDMRRQSTIQNTAGSFGDHSRQGSNAGGDYAARFGGADIVPVLCVNTWEHVWMWDWGVHGKQAYLAAWWERIDWETVWARCELQKPNNYAY